jgi:DNA-binding transcriptional LysR family regulator
MRRKIPNTSALVAFESAARHESFTKAAADLSLTQSAICRQIATLEDFVGVKLFQRTRRGVKLTEAGLAYSRRVAARLDAVEQDTLAIMARGGQGVTLELAVVPTFATQWLLPRLAEFHRSHPDIRINLTTRTRPFMFADTTFDAAICFSEANWPGTEASFLMRENAVPVCSPHLLETIARKKRRPSPEDIAKLPLLHQSTRPNAWRQWFESAGMRAAQDMSGLRYDLFSMLAQAAMHDMGVALIPPMLIEDELASGRLVVVHEHACVSEKAYYLFVPQHKVEAAALQAFSGWLQNEAARYQAGSV